LFLLGYILLPACVLNNLISCYDVLSFIFVGILLRLFVFYLVVTLIALQSMFAVAYSPALHQEQQIEKHADDHFENHEAKHHNLAELAQLALTESNGSVDNNHEHPSCEQGSSHQNHCHHSSLVYIDLQYTLLLATPLKNQQQPYQVVFSTQVSSPNFRPPIS
jgi:hypothetical protein